VRIALKELLRRPSRFLTAGGALTLLVVLLLVLGGILDGLLNGSTGAYRAQSASVFVFSSDSRDSLPRSVITADQQAAISSLSGVHEATGFGVALVAAHIPGRAEAASAAVFGYEAANRAVPPPLPAGQAYVDRSLARDGVELGQTLTLGDARTPVRVIGWVEDTSYSLSGGIWVEPKTWREVLAQSFPDQALPPDAFQAVLVTPQEGLAPQTLGSKIAAAVPGVDALTLDQAIASLPGVTQQQSVFTAVIGVTLVVAGLVVALFFALLTLERVGLFGVLKALGTPSRSLAGGLTIQALLIAAGAFVVGGSLTWVLAQLIPADVPLQLLPRRVVLTAVGLVVTALIGSAISFRKIIRIDPAIAVGGS
jgi:putative ABC transport system permease protein